MNGQIILMAQVLCWSLYRSWWNLSTEIIVYALFSMPNNSIYSHFWKGETFVTWWCEEMKMSLHCQRKSKAHLQRALLTSNIWHPPDCPPSPCTLLKCLLYRASVTYKTKTSYKVYTVFHLHLINTFSFISSVMHEYPLIFQLIALIWNWHCTSIILFSLNSCFSWGGTNNLLSSS